MTKEKKSEVFSIFQGKAEGSDNELNPIVACVFALVNRFVLLARSITVFFLTLGGIVLSPVLPQKHHNEVFSFLYEQSDKLYMKALCDKKNINAKSLNPLEDAKNNSKNLESYKAFASHANTLYTYVGKKKKWDMSVHTSILSHAPAVGLAFLALQQVLEVFESDKELDEQINSTAKKIGDLIKELEKTSKRVRKRNQLQAFELEKFNTLFHMIEDGCNKLRLVIQDRGDSVWKRFSMNGAHQASLDSWHEAVKKMMAKENTTKVNIIFYQTQYLSELAETHLKFTLVDVALSIIALVFLWIIHRNVEQILRRLDPLHVKMIRMAQGFLKRIPTATFNIEHEL